MLSTVSLPSLTIPNGAAVSNILNANKSYADAESIDLYAPAALDALTFTIEVNANPDAVAASTGWVTLQIGDPAADAAPPAAGKGRTYYELATAFAFRLKSSGNVAADRTFLVSKSCYT